MTVAQYSKQIDAILKPAEDAIAKLREKAEASATLSDVFIHQEQNIRSQVTTKVNQLTNDLLEALLPKEQVVDEVQDDMTKEAA